MNILLQSTAAQFPQYVSAFAHALPQARLIPWEERAAQPAPYACIWDPEPGSLAQLPDLQVIFTLSAGVDNVMRERPSVPVVRLVNAGMAPQMAQYVAYGALHFGRNFDRARVFQSQSSWEENAFGSVQRRVGILGYGTLGQEVGKALQALGFEVHGWRSCDTREHGEAGLERFLGQSEIIVNLLPSTAATRAFFNAERLAQLPAGAALINAGRGSTLDAQALLASLNSGHLRGALLDVFETEPLPAHSPLWQHPSVLITPHVAAATLIEPSVECIARNIIAHGKGAALVGKIDPSAGY